MQIEEDAFEVRLEAVAFLFEAAYVLGEGFEEILSDLDASAQGVDVLAQLDVVDRDGWVVRRIDRGADHLTIPRIRSATRVA